MELKYYRCGDYYFPDLGLTEEKQHPIGKYGQMRMKYLRKNRPGLFTRLLLSGKLMEHLHEIDDTCYERLELMVTQMKQAEGITEALKAPLVDHPQQMLFCLFPGEKRDIILNSASLVPCSTLRIG